MSQRVERVLAANNDRSIDGIAVTARLLELRDNPDELLELLRRLMDDCHAWSAGWLLPAVCGWLPATALDQVAAFAREHLMRRPDCWVASDVLEHYDLRRPSDEPAPALHIAYPESLVNEWLMHWRLRTGHPTWVVLEPSQRRASVGGVAARRCPRCNGPVEILLSIQSTSALTPIRSREAVEFTWCANCSPFVEDASYAEIDDSGHAVMMPFSMVIEADQFSTRAPLPRREVGLVDLGREWRRQDWLWSNNIENLHRVGGEPSWIQDEHIPECARCGGPMRFVAQVGVEDLTYDEGITYLHWCDECSVTGVVYQQT